jgi:hypothetical protein
MVILFVLLNEYIRSPGSAFLFNALDYYDLHNFSLFKYLLVSPRGLYIVGALYLGRLQRLVRWTKTQTGTWQSLSNLFWRISISMLGFRTQIYSVQKRPDRKKCYIGLICLGHPRRGKRGFKTLTACRNTNKFTFLVDGWFKKNNILLF